MTVNRQSKVLATVHESEDFMVCQARDCSQAASHVAGADWLLKKLLLCCACNQNLEMTVHLMGVSFRPAPHVRIFRDGSVQDWDVYLFDTSVKAEAAS
jgi:hypothetical protein